MAESELYKKGEAIRRNLMGEAAFARRQAEYHSNPVMKKFIDVATETVFGSLWARPGLDIKTRTLICVGSSALRLNRCAPHSRQKHFSNPSSG